ncbi:MAG: hypothetical protein ABFD03_00940, partial [Clostridiaceae bacterium]
MSWRFVYFACAMATACRSIFLKIDQKKEHPSFSKDVLLLELVFCLFRLRDGNGNSNSSADHRVVAHA